jgi:hypothetical protein
MSLVSVSKSYNSQVHGFPKLLSKIGASIIIQLSAFHLERLKAVDVGSHVPYGKCDVNESFSDDGI